MDEYDVYLGTDGLLHDGFVVKFTGGYVDPEVKCETQAEYLRGPIREPELTLWVSKIPGRLCPHCFEEEEPERSIQA